MGDDGWAGAAAPQRKAQGVCATFTGSFPTVQSHGSLIPKYNQVFGFASHKRGGEVLLPHFGVIT